MINELIKKKIEHIFFSFRIRKRLGGWWFITLLCTVKVATILLDIASITFKSHHDERFNSLMLFIFVNKIIFYTLKLLQSLWLLFNYEYRYKFS